MIRSAKMAWASRQHMTWASRQHMTCKGDQRNQKYGFTLRRETNKNWERLRDFLCNKPDRCLSFQTWLQSFPSQNVLSTRLEPGFAQTLKARRGTALEISCGLIAPAISKRRISTIIVQWKFRFHTAYYTPNRLNDWLTDWLTDWLSDWLTDWLTDWLADWLTYRLTDWPTDRLTEWLTDGHTHTRTHACAHACTKE